MHSKHATSIPTNIMNVKVICETYYTATKQQDRCVGTKRVKATQTHVDKHACQDKPPNAYKRHVRSTPTNIMTVNAISET